jgi:hypothetical protein
VKLVLKFVMQNDGNFVDVILLYLQAYRPKRVAVNKLHTPRLSGAVLLSSRLTFLSTQLSVHISAVLLNVIQYYQTYCKR